MVPISPLISRTNSINRKSLMSSPTLLHSTAPSSLRLFSPSKINLFLRILGKRPDNYHDLSSLFQAISLGDILEIERVDSGDDDFSCNMPGVPTDSSNLVLKAVNLIRSRTNNDNVKFSINLNKKCPAQAGLGGGSANAATALYGVNKLLGKPCTQEELIEMSGELGSDVTFFLSKGTAYCTGRGEIMNEIPALKTSADVKCTIVKINLGLSTPTVFKALDYDQLSSKDPEEILKQFGSKGTEVAEEYFVNDLEVPAFSCLPKLLELKKLLSTCSFSTVMMSGSGTSIFCLGESGDSQVWKEICGREDVMVFETRFINRRSEEEWYDEP